MSDLVDVGKLEDFQPGQIRACKIEGNDVAVANIDGTLRAFSNLCPHQAVLLSSFGSLVGAMVVCGVHNSIFDSETGEVLTGPARQPLAIYEVAIEGATVFVCNSDEPASSPN